VSNKSVINPKNVCNHSTTEEYFIYTSILRDDPVSNTMTLDWNIIQSRTNRDGIGTELTIFNVKPSVPNFIGHRCVNLEIKTHAGGEENRQVNFMHSGQRTCESNIVLSRDLVTVDGFWIDDRIY
jgi:hypothetical protein